MQTQVYQWNQVVFISASDRDFADYRKCTANALHVYASANALMVSRLNLECRTEFLTFQGMFRPKQQQQQI